MFNFVVRQKMLDRLIFGTMEDVRKEFDAVIIIIAAIIIIMIVALIVVIVIFILIIITVVMMANIIVILIRILLSHNNTSHGCYSSIQYDIVRYSTHYNLIHTTQYTTLTLTRTLTLTDLIGIHAYCPGWQGWWCDD